MQDCEPYCKGLDEEDKSRIDQLLSELHDSSGDFFRLYNGQSQKISFDMKFALGMKTRTIRTPEGPKQITRLNFIIWNHKVRRFQYFSFARKWTKRALETMKDFNTTSLIASRTGAGMFDTNYSFSPS